MPFSAHFYVLLTQLVLLTQFILSFYLTINMLFSVYLMHVSLIVTRRGYLPMAQRTLRDQ